MADNVSITEGSGKTVATDDVSSVHYQIVKLADGTADASAVIAADVGAKANALRVAPANDITDATYIGDIKFGESLPAGTAAIGKLAANSGVDIGDVTLTAGTAAIGKLAANSGVDIGDVDVLSLPALAAGTNAIGKLAANTGVDIGDVDVTSIAAGSNIIGAVKRDIVNYTKVWKYVALANTNETTIWDPTGGTKFVVTDIHVSATAAGTCTLRDGTAGSTIWIASLAANGGFVSNLQTPIQSATADNILTAQASAATQYIFVSGYEV